MNDSPREEFDRELELKEQRRLREKQRGDEDRWAGLGMLGLVGWAFTIPMLAVLGLGIWADRRFESPFAWSLMAVFIGAFIGGLNAGDWVRNEQRKSEEENE